VAIDPGEIVMKSCYPVKIFIFALFILLVGVETLQAQHIKIATDQNMWYPFSFEQNGVSKGLHIDIVNLALNNLGHTPTFDPLPWKRCLWITRYGEYDALVGASYKPERAEFLNYPSDASSNSKSEYRITQVEFSIITSIDNPYEFNGDVKSIPHPVRATLGYSVVDNLKKQGVFVIETPGDVNSFQMLQRDKKGCIITLPEIANMLMKQSGYQGSFHISNKPFKSKSYFLVFSKKSLVSKAQQKKIWKEIKKIREDNELMDELLRKYSINNQAVTR
jgi:polar amino acid transport system substrate-binding protein